ncbi:MAG: lysophospholipid acyltransferase family protein, partial [Acidimicrobiales bacterium]
MRPALPRPRLGFPYSAPTWPDGVDRPRPVGRTGTDYDTTWARRYPVRLLRALALDGVTKPVLWAVAAPRIRGVEHLAGLAPPVIFAPNHASHLDTPLLLTCMPERFRHHTVVAAGADYFFDRRWKGALWSFHINAVPVDRFRVSPRSTRVVAAALGDGWNLVIFPEGGRSPDGWGQPFRGGAAYLALRCDVPVVPVHIEGTGRILRKGRKLPSPASTRVTFG